MIKCLGFLINGISLVFPKKACDIAYRLFSTPRKGRLKANDLPHFLVSAERSELLFQDLKIKCYRWNIQQVDAPLIMLFHGWESNASRWEALVSSLGKNYQYICIDAIGSGLSEGSALSAIEYSRLMGQCFERFKPSFVVGHSLGAFALLYQVCNVHYSFIDKIVLLGGLDRFQVIIDNYTAMLGYNETVKHTLSEHLTSLLGESLSDYSSSKFISSLSTTALIIHDKEDTVVPLSDCLNYHALARERGVEVFYTDGLGHSMQDEVVFKKIGEYFKN